MIVSSRSLGMVMIVSTQSRSASRPRSACSCRLRPSNLNGLVTTATVSAPSSVARLAITGAAPGPGPPPRPGGTQILSAAPSGDKDQFGAVELRDDLLGIPERRRAADVRIGAGAEALGQLAADLDLH